MSKLTKKTQEKIILISGLRKGFLKHAKTVNQKGKELKTQGNLIFKKMMLNHPIVMIEMEFKTTMRCYFTAIKMVKIPDLGKNMRNVDF
jgi:hypothetical protein